MNLLWFSFLLLPLANTNLPFLSKKCFGLCRAMCYHVMLCGIRSISNENKVGELLCLLSSNAPNPHLVNKPCSCPAAVLGKRPPFPRHHAAVQSSVVSAQVAFCLPCKQASSVRLTLVQVLAKPLGSADARHAFFSC